MRGLKPYKSKSPDTRLRTEALDWQEVAKKMPSENSDEDLNPQKVGSDSVNEPMTFQDVKTKILPRNSDVDLSQQEYFKIALRSKA